jgi:hypothetical protein
VTYSLRATATTLAFEDTSDRVGLDTAYRLLWLAVLFDILAFGVGFGWDRSWHVTHPFEDFFSPPHLFIYSMHLCATITLAYIAFTPDLRRWFGDTFSLPLLPFAIPGAIALAGGGFAITGLAGFFDGIWHTRFGLDETLWSFPHSMLGWGLMIAFLGITWCRLALAQWKPVGSGPAIVFGFLVFSSSIERVPGPFMNNISPDVLRFIAAIPVLAAEPAFSAHDADLPREQHHPFQPGVRSTRRARRRSRIRAPAALRSTATSCSRTGSATHTHDRLRPAHRAGSRHRPSRNGSDRLALVGAHRSLLRRGNRDHLGPAFHRWRRTRGRATHGSRSRGGRANLACR